MTEEAKKQEEDIIYIELGSEEYPIPIGAEYDNNGDVVNIKWLASEEEAIYVPTMRTGETQEQLYGRFIRDVVSDPVLLRSMEEMLRRTDSSYADKTEKSLALTMVGDPGCGKTYLASRIAELLHPRGALKVNCHNLPEPERLYQATSVSVNSNNMVQAVRAYIDRANNPDSEIKVPGELIAKIAKEFGGEYVDREARDGRIINVVDFEGIKNDYPSYHVSQVMSEIIKTYNIPYEEDKGSIGLSYQNGPLLRALIDPTSPDYGRPIILDESNRIPEVDAWLTISAFFSDPNVDDLVLRGEDDREFVIRRKDLPENFLLISTANPATEEMGSSAQTMTRPMVSRSGANIDIITSGRAQKHDYISRALKHFTGVPAYMLYKRDEGYYNNNMEELAENLMYLRIVGLDGVEEKGVEYWTAKLLANPYLREEGMPESLKLIPKDELFNIKHIDRTIKVATNYGTLLFETQELIENMIKDEEIAEPYRDYLREVAVVDLRYLFKLYQHTQTSGIASTEKKEFKGFGGKRKSQEEIRMRQQQRVADRKEGRKFARGNMLDVGTIEKLLNIIKPDNYKDFFTNLDDVEIKTTATKIHGAVEKILAEARECKFEKAGYVGTDSVAKLYNARPEDFEENVEAKDIAKVLIDSINDAMGTNLKPDDISGREALELLEKLIKEDTEENTVIVPSHEHEDYTKKNFKPFQRTVVNSSTEATMKPEDLATVDQFMDSMIIDKAREHNIKKLMAQAKQNVAKGVKGPEYDENTDIKPYKEILAGENPDIFITIIALQDNSNKEKGPEARFAVLVYNKKEDRVGIVSTFDVSESDHKKLKEKGIILVNADKETVGDEFMRFIKAGSTTIKDEDIYNPVYLLFNPEFVGTAENDTESIWGSVGVSNIGDIENIGLVCRIEKPQEKVNVLDRIRSGLVR